MYHSCRKIQQWVLERIHCRKDKRTFRINNSGRCNWCCKGHCKECFDNCGVFCGWTGKRTCNSRAICSWTSDSWICWGCFIVWCGSIISGMKITLTLYVLAIIISLALMFRSKMAKKEDYLSTAFDLSIMLTVFLWDKERVSIFLPILLILLFIYFIVLYFGIIRPTRKSESFDVIIQKERKEYFKQYISIIFIVIPIIINSTTLMVILLLSFIIVDRLIFYRKHKALI